MIFKIITVIVLNYIVLAVCNIIIQSDTPIYKKTDIEILGRIETTASDLSGNKDVNRNALVGEIMNNANRIREYDRYKDRNFNYIIIRDAVQLLLNSFLIGALWHWNKKSRINTDNLLTKMKWRNGDKISEKIKKYGE